MLHFIAKSVCNTEYLLMRFVPTTSSFLMSAFYSLTKTMGDLFSFDDILWSFLSQHHKQEGYFGELVLFENLL